MKKVLAAVLAAAMSLSMAAVSFAADGSTCGVSGEIGREDLTSISGAVSAFVMTNKSQTKAATTYVQNIAAASTRMSFEFMEDDAAGNARWFVSSVPVTQMIQSTKKPSKSDFAAVAAGDAKAATKTAGGAGLFGLGAIPAGTISTIPQFGHLYTFNSGSHVIGFVGLPGIDGQMRPDNVSGHITVKTNQFNTGLYALVGGEIQQLVLYVFTISPDYGVRDFEMAAWTVEIDLGRRRVFDLTGNGAYSVARTVSSDMRYAVVASGRFDLEVEGDETGSIFRFDNPIDGETRIRCDAANGSKYVDLFFDGNYGTDIENLRVVTSSVDEIEDYFEDVYDEVDIDYYDFVGKPKFATAVTVRIDADENSFIYEYDKTTGDLTNITDECTWSSNGWTFTRKVLTTYIVTEELYEDANVIATEPEVDEPSDEPSEEDGDGEKSNPGTGANDMVGVATALAVVSLVAAGAVAFKKASK